MKTVDYRRALWRWLPVAVLAAGLAASDARGQDMEALLKDVQGADDRLRVAAAEKLGKAGVDAVAPLAEILGSEKPAAVEAARTALYAIAHRAARHGADEERARAAKALAEACSAARPARAKNGLLEILSFVGGDESVEAIAAALDAPETHEMACLALGRIAAPAAAQALRDAAAGDAERSEPRQIALLNAIGLKRDPEAAQLLSKAARREPSEEVRLAALEALSTNPMAYAYSYVFWDALPSPGGAASPRPRHRVWACLLRVGESFLESGEVGAASDHFCELADVAATVAERCAAIVGLGRSGRRGAPELVFAALEDENTEVRATALAALSIMRGPTVASIGDLLERAGPPLKADLLAVLGKRREPEAGELAASFLNDEDSRVRAAALEALEGRSSEKAVRALLEALEKGGPAAREGAAGVLGRMPGEDVSRALLEAAKAAAPEGRARLLDAVGRRGDPAAGAFLAESARDASEAVRLAAYRGLGGLGKVDALPVLLAGIDRGPPDAPAAERALARLPVPETFQALMDAASARSGPPKAALIRILAKRRDPRVVELLLRALGDGDEGVRVAALRGLCRQDDRRVLPVLLETAARGPADLRPEAVLGCLRFGPELEKDDPRKALAIYHDILELEGASRMEERREAVAGMGRLADPSSIPRLRPLLDDGALRQAAAAAVLPIAVKLGDDRKEEAVGLLKAAIPLAPSSPGARAGVERLRSLGVDYDIARQSGFITSWWLLGPLPNPENRLFTKDPLDPEGVDSTELRPVKAGDRALQWKRHRSADPRGIIELFEVIAPREWVGAYAYAELTVPDVRRVTFKFGSDDSLVCWLNGKKMHTYGGARGLTVDQDSVDTKLEAGKNRILLKVLNQGGGWNFCLRITDRRGAPLVLETDGS